MKESMAFLNEERVLTRRLQDCVSSVNPSLIDDLDGILTWLNPNEQESNHQMRPPSLRLKNGFKLLLDNKEIPPTFIELIREYLFLQTRAHFFRNFENVRSFKEVQKLEKYYEFPLKYVNLFSTDEWDNELNGFRAYLFSNNAILRCTIKQRLRQLILDDDFDMATKIYFWICQALECSLVYLILDILMDKVCEYAEHNMRGSYRKRYVVMETFNTFISKYWSSFANMLKCAEDEHEITTQIFNCFEKEFLRIRTSEIFEIFVANYPDSSPTLLELRNVLKSPEDFTHLISEFLRQFQERRMNPSITTAEILLSYVNAVKSILTVDTTGRYFQLLTNFIRPYVMERRDAVTTFLYAMLELDVSEISDPNVTSIHMEVLKDLARQLKDPEFTSLERFAAVEKNKGSIDTGFPVLFDHGKALHEQILDSFLHWTPEPSGTIRTKSNSPLLNKNLLDIILEIFDSKDVVINEFLAIFTRKLLALKYYRLDPKWLRSLKLLKKKFDVRNYSNGQDVSNINNIDVMLKDIKQSEELSTKMHAIPELSDKVYPKFISYLFWNAATEPFSKSTEFRLPTWLNNEVGKYARVYSQMKPGRKLHLFKYQGTVELCLTFDDGRVLESEVSFDRAAVISVFLEQDSQQGLTLMQIITKTGLIETTVKIHLQYWLDMAALYLNFDEGVYKILENYEKAAQQEHNVPVRQLKCKLRNIETSSETIDNIDDKQHQQFIDSMSRALPFIQGMLTNLGSLKPEKIHSFLKIAVPKEVGYSATLTQLETYLNVLVDEERLLATANGSYKLNKNTDPKR